VSHVWIHWMTSHKITRPDIYECAMPVGWGQKRMITMSWDSVSVTWSEPWLYISRCLLWNMLQAVCHITPNLEWGLSWFQAF
jgi:hypothetical protein